MLNWLFKRRKESQQPRSLRDTRARAKTRTLEAGKTDRLNQLHWTDASDVGINTFLGEYLPTVRARATYEALHNPNVEGVIATHIDDVIGPGGPILQVLSTNKKYNAALEQVWRDWWAMPDITGLQSGPELLGLCIRMLWLCGEYLVQEVTDGDGNGPVSLKLKALHPRRLETPTDKTQDNVTLGIKRTQLGRPTTYYIESTPDNESLTSMQMNFVGRSAKRIIHGFQLVEPDQARGVPWLTSCLPTVADLRDYDTQVLDAARAAADMGVYLSTKHPDAAYVDLAEDDNIEIERRMLTALPSGWEPNQITPQQPSTRYIEYRAERLRDLGRPHGMPLMMVQLDSGNHNYSSARFDAQIYQRGINRLRGWLVRHTLNRLVRDVIVEARLVPGVLPGRPARVDYQWTWTALPHVDPLKEENAVTERIANGTSTYRDECAKKNADWEEVFDQQKREMDKRVELGLPILSPKSSLASDDKDKGASDA